MTAGKQPSPASSPLLAPRTVAAGVAALAALAIAAIWWRGSAILLDLSGLGAALWCF